LKSISKPKTAGATILGATIKLSHPTSATSNNL